MVFPLIRTSKLVIPVDESSIGEISALESPLSSNSADNELVQLTHKVKAAKRQLIDALDEHPPDVQDVRLFSTALDDQDVCTPTDITRILRDELQKHHAVPHPEESNGSITFESIQKSMHDCAGLLGHAQILLNDLFPALVSQCCHPMITTKLKSIYLRGVLGLFIPNEVCLSTIDITQQLQEKVRRLDRGKVIADMLKKLDFSQYTQWLNTKTDEEVLAHRWSSRSHQRRFYTLTGLNRINNQKLCQARRDAFIETKKVIDTSVQKLMQRYQQIVTELMHDMGTILASVKTLPINLPILWTSFSDELSAVMTRHKNTIRIEPLRVCIPDTEFVAVPLVTQHGPILLCQYMKRVDNHTCGSIEWTPTTIDLTQSIVVIIKECYTTAMHRLVEAQDSISLECSTDVHRINTSISALSYSIADIQKNTEATLRASTPRGHAFNELSSLLHTVHVGGVVGDLYNADKTIEQVVRVCGEIMNV